MPNDNLGMTFEEAIDKIKRTPLYCIESEFEKEKQSDLFKALKLAVEAMEKQVPKKPIKVDSGVYDYRYDYECPNCRKNVEDIDFHCLCGQKLDWSDEKMNDMKERLINLIQESVNGCARHWAEVIADNLVENGAILPPCKVGDEVYYIAFGKVYRGICHAITRQKNSLQIHLYDYDGDNASYSDKDVFATKEEAEKALFDRLKKDC